MRRLLAGIVFIGIASTASAQSTYVGASFIADVVRTSGASPAGGSGGETFGGALRIGAPLGRQWGVELEFARTGELEMVPNVYPASVLEGVRTGFTFSSDASPVIFPAPRIESERRLATISTLLWWDHELNDRVSLAYLGGVAFTRTTWRVRISYPDFPLRVPPLPIPRPTIFPPPDLDQETTFYDADVAVGFEGRIRMTDHVRLVPGLRLQTITDGWAIRPGVGLQWQF